MLARAIRSDTNVEPAEIVTVQKILADVLGESISAADIAEAAAGIVRSCRILRRSRLLSRPFAIIQLSRKFDRVTFVTAIVLYLSTLRNPNLLCRGFLECADAKENAGQTPF